MKKTILTASILTGTITLGAQVPASIDGGRQIPDPARYKGVVPDRVINVPDSSFLANAVDEIYIRMYNESLARVPVNAGNLAAEMEAFACIVREYETDQYAGASQKMTSICIIAKAAEAYQQAASLMKQPYDKAAIDSLLKEFETVLPQNNHLSQTQRVEFTGRYMALNRYPEAVGNFNDVLLPSLLNLDKIGNDAQRDKALETIDETINRFNDGIPNSVKNSYGKDYLYLNDRVEELRNAIRDYKTLKLKNKKNFRALLQPVQ